MLLPLLFDLISVKMPLDSEVLDLFAEGIAIDSEEARGAHLVAFGLFKHQRDEKKPL